MYFSISEDEYSKRPVGVVRGWPCGEAAEKVEA
jgi:hypothetical protein